MSRQLACAGADRSFGPAVPASCRDGFDFTLLFEQIFFTLVPAVALILTATLRLWQLRHAPVVTTGKALLLSKQVSCERNSSCCRAWLTCKTHFPFSVR